MQFRLPSFTPTRSSSAKPLRQIFLRRLLVAYLLFATFITGLQLYLEYQHIRREVLATLNFLADTSLPAAETALWDFQTPLLEAMAKGVAGHPAVEYVQVKDQQGKVLTLEGKQSEVAKVDNAGLVVIRELRHQVSEGKKQVLGTLTVASSYDYILFRLKGIALGVGLSISAQLIFLAGILHFFVAALVVKPLGLFSKQVGAMIDQHRETPIDLGKVASEEIETLQIGFNTLLHQVEEGKATVARQNLELEQKISERTREVREKQAHFESIFEGASNGIFFADPDGRLVRFNASFSQMLGKSSADLTNTRLQECTFDDDVAAEDLMLAALRDGQHESYRIEKRFIHSNGESVWTDVAVSAIRDESLKLINLVGVVVDVSERHEIETALKAAKESAEEATRAKSDFLANMSHEIRTPMNAIIGMSYLALQQELGTQQRNYVEKVHRSAEGLLGIINDILDFSKIEAGKLTMEKVDFQLEDVMDHLANLVGLKASDKGLELHFKLDLNLPTSLVGDPLRLGQTLINLGNNAVKFTERGDIVIGATVVSKDERSVEMMFWVQDAGIGMTAEQCSRLFKSFSQADTSTSRKYGGTGLGLAISKNLVEMMDGRIWVESEPDVGSTFRFTAKFDLSANPVSRRMVRAEEVAGLRALVIDDNQMARDIVGNTLQGFGLQCDLAANGAEGLAMFKSASARDLPYELLLVDWRMPDMDGLECIKAMGLASSKLAPAILITAYGREDAQKAAAHLGVAVQAYMSKPATPSTLLETIGVVLRIGPAVVARTREVNVMPKDAMRLLAGARVLLVEDNEMNQELALALLAQAGIQAVVADNGQLALDAMETQGPFDGILMDCQMPVMDGYTASRRIRQNPLWADLPIIAMTANAMAGDREKVLDAGMNDHIGKPIDVGAMFNTMARWIKPANPLLLDAIAATQDATEKVTLPDLPGIDTAAGLMRVQGDKAFYRKMLLKFRGAQTDFASAMQAALGDDDVNAPRRLAHTLKGTAGTIGASQLQLAAAELEKACEDRTDLALIEALTLKVTQALVPVMTGLKRLDTNAGDALAVTPAIFDKEQLLKRIKDLSALIADSDALAGEAIDSLAKETTGTPLAPLTRSIASALADFDFDAAEAELPALVQAVERMA